MTELGMSVAVIGCGYWGPNLVRTFSRAAGARLATICDMRADVAREVGAKYAPSAKIECDYRRVLDDTDIDAVVIATPAVTHHSIAWDALDAGKHVLVEKPLAVTSAQAIQLRDLAILKSRVLMVGHIFLYNAAVLKIREYIDAGAIGEVRHVNARRLNLGRIQTDHNALWSFAPHELSILNYWLDQEPISVSANGFSYLHAGIEDIVFVSLRYGDGVGANLHFSWLDPQKVREITVVGTEGMLIYDDTNPNAKVQLLDKRVSREVIDSEGRMRVSIHAAGSIAPEIEYPEPLLAEAEHFIECVNGRQQPRSDAESGLRVVRVIEAAERSIARAGAEVPLLETVEDLPALLRSRSASLA